MLFNSFTFLVFFAIVLGLHNLPLSWKVRKAILLVASYLFYAAWNPPFVLLLWISTVVDWFVARGLMRARGSLPRRLLVLASLGVNLGLLGFFKYGGFVTENLLLFLRSVDIHLELASPSIVLPVGISFYTFQTLSYTLDIYSGKARAWKSFLDFALFVTFFPQLVAGPIVRAVHFLPQCIEPRRASPRQLSWGLTLLVLGLFEKMVVADGLMAPISDSVYGTLASQSSLSAWGGTLAFSAQIFCDFAGYSTCAIGVAMCLGFAIPDNFRFPYAAIGFSDFWRRWHISLSSWLRDYLYIPLGGNRKGAARTYVNLAITMLLGGLWHGASWTFVVWGGLHGAYLIVERLARGLLPRGGGSKSTLYQIGLALATYALTCVTWVFFRARSFPQAFAILTSMFGQSDAGAASTLSPLDLTLVGIVTFLLLGTHWCMRNTTVQAVWGRFPWWAGALFLTFCLVAIVTMSGYDRAFIYFQF